MKVSIITVSRNSSGTIADTISSVRSQSHEPLEYIVIDGASTDGTQEILYRHRSQIDTVVSEPDHGIYDAMNKGIMLATGDIIGFLNADDMYQDSNVVSDVVRKFQSEAIDACYGDLVYVDPVNTALVRRYWRANRDIRHPGGGFRVPPHPTFFVKKEIYDRYGIFDPEFKLAGDYELIARLVGKHGINAVHLPRVLVRMRLGGVTNNSLGNIVRQNIEIIRANRINGIEISAISHLLSKSINRLGQFLSKPPALR